MRNNFFSNNLLQRAILDAVLIYLFIVLYIEVETYCPRLWAVYLLIMEEQERALTVSSEAVFPFAETLVDWSIAAVLPPQ